MPRFLFLSFFVSPHNKKCAAEAAHKNTSFFCCNTNHAFKSTRNRACVFYKIKTTCLKRLLFDLCCKNILSQNSESYNIPHIKIIKKDGNLPSFCLLREIWYNLFNSLHRCGDALFEAINEVCFVFPNNHTFLRNIKVWALVFSVFIFKNFFFTTNNNLFA